MANDVIELPFVVGHAGTHLALQGLHRQYLYAHIDLIPDVEGKMLDEKVIRHKSTGVNNTWRGIALCCVPPTIALHVLRGYACLVN